MAEAIAITVSVAALIGSVIGIYNKFASAVKGLSTESEQKIGRVYKRLDEVKVNTDEKYTKKEVCIIIHDQLNKTLEMYSADIKEIKTDLKALLRISGVNPDERISRG